jgi:hypothetical protein
MPKVDFNMDNIKKCQCTVCPVQAQSECVAKKMKILKKQMSQSVPKPEDVPGVYCSQGQAVCKDLDPGKACVCPTCAVWTENNLQSNYYCQKGNAEKNG